MTPLATFFFQNPGWWLGFNRTKVSISTKRGRHRRPRGPRWRPRFCRGISMAHFPLFLRLLFFLSVGWGLLSKSVGVGTISSVQGSNKIPQPAECLDCGSVTSRTSPLSPPHLPLFPGESGSPISNAQGRYLESRRSLFNVRWHFK